MVCIRPVQFGSNLEISKMPTIFELSVHSLSNVRKEILFKYRSFPKFWTPLTLPSRPLYMAQWRALGEKSEADLHDTSGTSVACFDVGTPLATSSINQTPPRHPPDTPQTPQRYTRDSSKFKILDNTKDIFCGFKSILKVQMFHSSVSDT